MVTEHSCNDAAPLSRFGNVQSARFISEEYNKRIFGYYAAMVWAEAERLP